MLAIQSLKKQLRGVRSTGKLTKAMKTVATVKFSRLNALYSGYSVYGEQCNVICKRYGKELAETVKAVDPMAPPVVIVIGSNKGLCGNFNAEILNFAYEELCERKDALLVVCGKKASAYCKAKKLTIEKEYVFGDVPTCEESNALLDDMLEWRASGKASRVYVIYPQYVNMMKQTPTICELFSTDGAEEDEGLLLVPDRQTVVQNAAKSVFRSMLYKLVLEAAIGAQAATLLTMRSAYDTATEYAERLEKQIQRMRQTAVTADVLETAVERNE